MFKWQTSVAIAITISLFHCLADKWNPTPRPMPTQSQSIWQHDARERVRESGINRDDESKNASSAEWKPKRLSSCLTYTTCRNYSGIFGSWPLEQTGIDCQWCAAPFPFFFTQPMPCHKSIRAKFLAKALKALQKAQFFSCAPRHAVMSLSCWTKAVACSAGCQFCLWLWQQCPCCVYAPWHTCKGHRGQMNEWQTQGNLLSVSRWEHVCALSSCSNCGCCYCCCCCACVDFACSHCLKLAPGIWLFSPYNASRIQRNQANISPLPAHLYATSLRPHWT